MGTFLIFCLIKLKFPFWLNEKRWHTSWKFQLEIRNNKNVMAKKHLTNLYEMNSRFMMFNVHMVFITFCVGKQSLNYMWCHLGKPSLWRSKQCFPRSAFSFHIFMFIDYFLIMQKANKSVFCRCSYGTKSTGSDQTPHRTRLIEPVLFVPS